LDKSVDESVEKPAEIQPEEAGGPDRRTKMTAGQYLKRSPRLAGDGGIGGLVRSLYSSKVMRFEEWDAAVETLLKKKLR
jgi:hypothetical protein